MPRLFRLALPLAALALFAGCRGGSKAPKTYPVKGKVVRADGSAYPGGMIEFRSTTQPYNALGRIKPEDGTFTLNTLWEGKERLPGAVEGAFRVTVTPDLGQDQTKQKGEPPVPVQLAEEYVVKPDSSNDFTITLPGP